MELKRLNESQKTLLGWLICSIVVFPHWEILISSLETQKGVSLFIVQLMAILVLIGTVFVHLRDVPWKDIFKFGAFGTYSRFCEWAQFRIDVCIPHRKYQVNLYSSAWFSAAYAAVIARKNHFFCFYQLNKSSVPKIKFKQASYSRSWVTSRVHFHIDSFSLQKLILRL